MALSATIYNFAIQLSNVDRGVYEALALKVARHPSEAEDHLIARVLAYCLEFTEGLSFSRGLSDPDEPALAVRDLTGELRTWIDIGAPDAARLHKAAKAAPRVAVYTHKAAALLRQLEGERIHRAETIELYAFDRDLIAGLAARLERRMAFDLSVTDGHLFVSLEGATLSGDLERLPINRDRP
ncbi:MAG TPA: YaeQ family protein [Burkholderiales bacterium]|nr:YaeQ family protein [Burkholderiales bacterium]